MKKKFAAGFVLFLVGCAGGPAPQAIDSTQGSQAPVKLDGKTLTCKNEKGAIDRIEVVFGPDEVKIIGREAKDDIEGLTLLAPQEVRKRFRTNNEPIALDFGDEAGKRRGRLQIRMTQAGRLISGLGNAAKLKGSQGVQLTDLHCVLSTTPN